MVTMCTPKIVEFGLPGNRSRSASSLVESAALCSKVSLRPVESYIPRLATTTELDRALSIALKRLVGYDRQGLSTTG